MPGPSFPPNFRIQKLWAFIAVDPDDNSEGIIGDMSNPLGPIPLIGADEARIRSLRPIAEAAAKQIGVEVRLVEFSTRTVIEVLNEDRSRETDQANH